MKRILFIGIGTLLLGACSPAADTGLAEVGADQFHNAFNNGQFDAIYKTADPEFRSSGSKAESIKFLSAVRAKLGRFKSGKTVGWNDNVGPIGHYVTLTREAQFERGRGYETFVFKIADRNLALVGYNINSNDMITG
jgi:hypothetical protein